MADLPGPDTLRSLAAALSDTVHPGDRNRLLAHADAWAAERLASGSLAEQLLAAQKQVALLEQDRKWWQENAIKRRRRAAHRRSEGSHRT